MLSETYFYVAGLPACFLVMSGPHIVEEVVVVIIAYALIIPMRVWGCWDHEVVISCQTQEWALDDCSRCLIVRNLSLLTLDLARVGLSMLLTLIKTARMYWSKLTWNTPSVPENCMGRGSRMTFG